MKRLRAAAVGGMVCLVLAVGAGAAGGDLDASFGAGGIVLLDGFESSRGALAPDGEIVVATSSFVIRDFRVARLTEGGALDSSFGSGGVVDAGLPRTSIGPRPVVQPDGKVVLAGQFGGPLDGIGAQRVVLARRNADGTPDLSFGDGGHVLSSGGGGAEYAYAVALQPDGKIVVAGMHQLPGDPGGTNFFVARYDAGGSPDLTFGSGGWTRVDFGPNTFDRALAVAIAPDGDIVAAGSTRKVSGLGARLAVARLSAAGVLEGSSALTLPNHSRSDAEGVAVDSAGRVLVTGWALSSSADNDDIIVARYVMDGTLDPTFGSGGVAVADLGTRDLGRSVALQSDGKIVVAGWAGSNAGTDIALLRFTAGGSLDPTFSGDGIVLTDIADYDEASSVLLDASGRIVLVGSAFNRTTFITRAVVVRYLAGDSTRPVLSVPAAITASATSPAGAIVSFVATATDDTDPAPTVACVPASGTTFAIGATTVACTATDSSGNVDDASFVVTVLGASAQLERLTAAIRGFSLSAGTERSLLAKARAECGPLGALGNEARAQSGKKLTPAQAAEIQNDAGRIRRVLGCS